MAEWVTIRVSREPPPCKKDGADCPLRQPGCHGSCKAFQAGKAENEVIRGALQEYNRRRAIRDGKRFDPARAHLGMRRDDQ